MPNKTRNELTAGLFVLAGIVVVLGVVLWLGAADMLKARGQLATFYVPMSEGSVGVIEGAVVTLGDGRIGRVVEVQPDPGNRRCLYRVRLERTDILLGSDANALVVAPPVGQAKIVVMDAGDSERPADAENPIRLSGGLDQAMQRIDKVAANLELASAKLVEQLEPNDAASLLGKVHGVVGEIDLAAKSLGRITGNIEDQTAAGDPNSLVGTLLAGAGDIRLATTRLAGEFDANAEASLAGKLGRAATNIERGSDPNAEGYLMAKVHGTLGEIDGIVTDARPKIDRTVTAITATAEKIKAYTDKDIGEILAGLREANTKVLKIVGDFSVVSEEAKQIVTLNRDNIDETLDNLALVSVNLKAASQEIRRNPWRLLHRPDKKELRSQNLYDAVRAFSDGAAQLDQAIAKLRALQKLESEDPQYDKTTERIRKNLTETFEKFTKAEQALWEELQK